MSTAAVLGLGPMGRPIAGHLLGHGVDLRVWNRTASVAAAFGDRAVGEPSEVRAEVVFSALPDVDQFDDVAPDDVVRTWAGHGTRHVVVLSTTSRDKVTALQDRLQGHGIALVDAPMSGGDAGARAGTLSLMVGCSPESFATVGPLLRSFATTVEHLGPVGTGTAAKLANQVVVAATVAAVAEALDLARRAGVEGEQLLRVLRGGLAGGVFLDSKADRMLTGDHRLGGSIDNQVKDLRYAAELADQTGAPLRQARRTAELFVEAVERGLGGLDHTAVHRVVSADRPPADAGG
ncbi:NAD(P)-dependent oxidoreductase [Kineococcus sp. GCM10028916]|uniref:NAD(P)-dependent oxidoreductase n=1 Tax=Kineococcus sp. GCM10028916 TaxID=3273394 RepID=UPI003637FF67